jgi:hypothetical protein
VKCAIAMTSVEENLKAEVVWEVFLELFSAGPLFENFYCALESLIGGKLALVVLKSLLAGRYRDMRTPD